MPATRLWVGNVPYASTQDELETLFLQYGKISNVNFREGFSFIDFENEEDAHTAKTKLHETIYQGRRLQVEFARSDGPRPRVDRDRANDLPPSGDASDGSRHLYVARIPEAVTLDELRDFFARHGNVLNIKMLPQKGDFRSAFVDFEHPAEAAAAFRGTEQLHGVALRLDYNHRNSRPMGGGPPGRYDGPGGGRDRYESRYDSRADSGRYEGRYEGREREYGYDRGGGGYERPPYDRGAGLPPRDYPPPERGGGYGPYRGSGGGGPYDSRGGYDRAPGGGGGYGDRMPGYERGPSGYDRGGYGYDRPAAGGYDARPHYEPAPGEYARGGGGYEGRRGDLYDRLPPSGAPYPPYPDDRRALPPAGYERDERGNGGGYGGGRGGYGDERAGGRSGGAYDERGRGGGYAPSSREYEGGYPPPLSGGPPADYGSRGPPPGRGTSSERGGGGSGGGNGYDRERSGGGAPYGGSGSRAEYPPDEYARGAPPPLGASGRQYDDYGPRR